ncbi:hypothetical protein D3C71_193290 [compost metagenome]
MNRKKLAQDTVDICNAGNYAVSGAIVDIQSQLEHMTVGTQFFTSEQLTTLDTTQTVKTEYDTLFEVTAESSIAAIHRLAQEEERVLCLNFASAKNPGGGFLNGAIAQEESLAMSSALYHSQLLVPEFYQLHRNMTSCIYTDSIIYSPAVPVFRNDHGSLIPYSSCDFITSAAVNAGVVTEREPQSVGDIEELMKKRMDKLLALCYHKGQDTLLLGAWGCGVFRNDPVMIARLFLQLLTGKYKNVFKRVVFAVYSRNPRFIAPFEAAFGSINK